MSRDSQKSSFKFNPKFDPKLGVHSHADDLAFSYDEGVFGPQPEFRRLDANSPQFKRSQLRWSRPGVLDRDGCWPS